MKNLSDIPSKQFRLKAAPFIILIAFVLIASRIANLRIVVADFIYDYADRMWHEGRHEAMVPYLKWAARIDSHSVEYWQNVAWHLAFNLSEEAGKDGMAAQNFIEEALALLDEGIHANPDRYELYFYKGIIYYLRLKDYAEALKWFTLAQNHPHPSYVDRMVARAERKLALNQQNR